MNSGGKSVSYIAGNDYYIQRLMLLVRRSDDLVHLEVRDVVENGGVAPTMFSEYFAGSFRSALCQTWFVTFVSTSYLIVNSLVDDCEVF